MKEKIRFKGFTDDGKKVKLGDIFKISNEKSKINNEYQFLSVGKNGVTLQSENYDRQIAMLNNINSPILRKNQFVMNPYFLYLGVFKINEKYENGIISQAYKVFNYNKEKNNLTFLKYFIQIEKLISKFEKISDKGNAKMRRSVKIENFEKLIVNIPSLPEQERVGQFLSNIDRKIELEEEKLKKLQTYKKSMLQKVFSQQVRFHDDNGNIFTDDWKEVKLGDIIENKNGKPLEKYVSESGTHNFISIGNYTIDGKYNNNGQKIILNEITKEKLLKKGDFVMVLNDKGTTGELIGSTILISEDNKFIYNQRSEKIIIKNQNLMFFYILFNSDGFRKKIFELSQGGTQIYINFKNVKELKIFIPTIKEQEKIGNFFENIDKLIEQQKKLIDNNKLFKNGLLQKMF